MMRRAAAGFPNAMPSSCAPPVPAAQAHRDAKTFGRLMAVLRFMGVLRLMERCRAALRLASLPLLLALCLPTASAAAEETVARLGDREIGVADLSDYLARLPREERAVLNEDSALMFRAVRSYLVRQMVLQEAEAQAFDQEAEVSAELARLRDEALIELYLQSVAEPPSDYPSQADLQAAYDANISAFLEPRRYRLAQIFIADTGSGDGETPEGETELRGAARLAQVLRQLDESEKNFASLAMTYSDNADEAQRGGIVGWLAEPDIVPEIREAAIGLGEGEVSDPIRLEAGWHLVKLLETRPAGALPLSEVAGLLTERLRQQRALELRQAYLAELLQQNPVAINELAVSKLIAETEDQ